MALDDLYREVILDHYRNPRNQGHIEQADARAEGVNPLCGDEVTIELAIDDDTVTDVAISGQGCSISQASASMMSEAIKGKSISDVRDLAASFKGMMSIEDGAAPDLDPERPGAVLGDMEALQGVRQYPVRIKCADLAWTTMLEALDGLGSG